jgi:hypothetical protein
VDLGTTPPLGESITFQNTPLVHRRVTDPLQLASRVHTPYSLQEYDHTVVVVQALPAKTTTTYPPTLSRWSSEYELAQFGTYSDPAFQQFPSFTDNQSRWLQDRVRRDLWLSQPGPFTHVAPDMFKEPFTAPPSSSYKPAPTRLSTRPSQAMHLYRANSYGSTRGKYCEPPRIIPTVRAFSIEEDITAPVPGTPMVEIYQLYYDTFKRFRKAASRGSPGSRPNSTEPLDPSEVQPRRIDAKRDALMSVCRALRKLNQTSVWEFGRFYDLTRYSDVAKLVPLMESYLQDLHGRSRTIVKAEQTISLWIGARPYRALLARFGKIQGLEHLTHAHLVANFNAREDRATYYGTSYENVRIGQEYSKFLMEPLGLQPRSNAHRARPQMLRSSTPIRETAASIFPDATLPTIELPKQLFSHDPALFEAEPTVYVRCSAHKATQGVVPDIIYGPRRGACDYVYGMPLIDLDWSLKKLPTSNVVFRYDGVSYYGSPTFEQTPEELTVAIRSWSTWSNLTMVERLKAEHALLKMNNLERYRHCLNAYAPATLKSPADEVEPLAPNSSFSRLALNRAFIFARSLVGTATHFALTPVRVTSSAISTVTSVRSKLETSIRDGIRSGAAAVLSDLHDAKTSTSQSYTKIKDDITQKAGDLPKLALTTFVSPILSLWRSFKKYFKAAWRTVASHWPFATFSVLQVVLNALCIFFFVQLVRWLFRSCSLLDMIAALVPYISVSLLTLSWTLVYRTQISSTLLDIVHGRPEPVNDLQVVYEPPSEAVASPPATEPVPQVGMPITMQDLYDYFTAALGKEKQQIFKNGLVEAIPKFSRLGQAIEWYASRAYVFAIWVYNQIFPSEPLPTSEAENGLLSYRNSWLEQKGLRDALSSWFAYFSHYPDGVGFILRFHETVQTQVYIACGSNTKVTQTVRTSIMKMADEINVAYSEYQRFLRSAKKRDHPFWTAISGPLGGGKSDATHELAELVHAESHRVWPDDVRFQGDFSWAKVFMMNPADEYYDHYADQPFMVKDDYMCSRSPEIREREARFMMTYSSRVPMPLLVATPQDKGKFMTSDFLITTANNDFDDNIRLVDPDAYESRKTLRLELVSKIEPKFRVIRKRKDGKPYCQVTIPGKPTVRGETYLTTSEVAYIMVHYHVEHNREYEERPPPDLNITPFDFQVEGLRRTVQHRAQPQSVTTFVEDFTDRRHEFYLTYPIFSSLTLAQFTSLAPMHPWFTHHFTDKEYEMACILAATRPTDEDPEMSRAVTEITLMDSQTRARRADTQRGSWSWLSPVQIYAYALTLHAGFFSRPYTQQAFTEFFVKRFNVIPNAETYITYLNRTRTIIFARNVLITMALTTVISSILIALIGKFFPAQTTHNVSTVTYNNIDPEFPEYDYCEINHKEWTDEQSGAVKTAVPRRPAVHPVRKHVVHSASRAVPQVGAPTDLFQTAEEAKLFRNVFRINVEGRGECHGLGLFSDVFIAPAHTFKDLEHDAQIEFNSDGLGSRRIVLWSDLQTLEPSSRADDVIYLRCPVLDHFVNIVPYFIENFDQKAPILRMSPATTEFRGKTITVLTINTAKTFNYNPDYHKIHGCSIEIFGMPNGNGMCGAPYFQRGHGRVPFHIVGLHGAGDPPSETSYSYIVPKSEVEEVFQLYTKHVGVKPSAQLRFDGSSKAFPLLQIDQPFCPGTKPLGSFPEGMSLFVSTKSRIRATRMNPTHPGYPLRDSQGPISMDHVPTRFPVVLSGPGRPSAESYGLNRYNIIKDQDNIGFSLPPLILEPINPSMINSPDFSPRHIRILTLEEAVYGGAETHAMDMSKSVGYPYVMYGRNRTEVICDGLGGIKPAFRESVQKLLSDLEQEVVPCVAVLCTKDELLEPEDIAKGKVRLICASELAHYVVSKMYFEQFIAEVQKTPAVTPIAIGLNPHSITQWTILSRRLLKHNRMVAAGDVSGQEYTTPPECIELFIDYLNRSWPLDDRQTRIRTNLVWSLLLPIYGIKKRFFYASRGQGSGNFLTAFYNSFSLFLILLFVWRSLGHTDQEFIDNVETTIMGDDSVVSVNPKFSDYNMLSLTKGFADFGMFYTTSDKRIADCEYADISTIEFLKRSFRPLGKDGSSYLAPLRLSTILEIPMWEDTTASDDDLKNSWYSVLLELRHYNKSLYDKYYAISHRHMNHLGIVGYTPPPFNEAFRSLFIELPSTLAARCDSTYIDC